MSLLSRANIKYEVKEYDDKAERCVLCGHTSKDREIAIFKGLVRALSDVWQYCVKKQQYSFTTKEIKHLLEKRGTNITARFGDLVLFGGLLYKKGKGKWGFNIERTHDFFAGNYKIPTTMTKTSLGEYTNKNNYKTFKDFPELIELLDSNGEYKYY